VLLALLMLFDEARRNTQVGGVEQFGLCRHAGWPFRIVVTPHEGRVLVPWRVSLRVPTTVSLWSRSHLPSVSVSRLPGRSLAIGCSAASRSGLRKSVVAGSRCCATSSSSAVV